MLIHNLFFVAFCIVDLFSQVNDDFNNIDVSAPNNS